ncbi:MAG: hypothetical protein ACI87J_001016 [Colwellia sp.]
MEKIVPMEHIKETFEVINEASHNELRVKPHSGCNHLKTVNNSAIFAEEISEVAANFPIAFLKDPSIGTFKLSALFGLMPEENLFVNEKGDWSGTYIPVALNLDPFGLVLGAQSDEKRITINVNSPCVSKAEGEKLFENQQETPYLASMRKQLNTIVDASIQTDKLIAELVNRNLLTEFKISIEGLSEEPQVIDDLYTINTDEFSYLSKEDVFMFHEMNYWGAIYGIQQSLKQFKKLVQLSNAKTSNSKIKITIYIDGENS